jgi:hypothetical protein
LARDCFLLGGELIREAWFRFMQVGELPGMSDEMLFMNAMAEHVNSRN